MNCKPNEMAIVTRAGSGDDLPEAVLRSIVGHPVRVVHLFDGDMWAIEEPIPFRRVECNGPYGRAYATGIVEAIRDEYLTPLRGELTADDITESLVDEVSA